MAKPTPDYIEKLTTRLTNVWSSTWKQWEEIDTYLHGTFKLWPSVDERPEYHPPTAASKLDQAVSVQLPQIPTIHRFGKDKSEEQERKADVVETWLENLLAMASLEETVPTVPQVKRHMIAYGYAVIEGPLLDAVVIAKRQEDKPDRGDYEDDRQHQLAVRVWRVAKTRNPIRLRAPHPQEVLLHPDQKQPSEALKVVERFKGDLWELTKRKREEGLKGVKLVEFDPENDDYYQTVETKEYWSEEWHALLGSVGELLYVEQNIWGFVPYAHAFSGWGMRLTNDKRNDPKNMAVGLLTPILATLKLEAQQKTAEHNALTGAAWYQYGYSGHMKPEEAAQQLGTGALLTGKQEEFWTKQTPQLPQWLFQVGAKTMEDIEHGTFSKGLGGFRRPGVQTVGQEAILDTQGKQKFDVVSEQINQLFTIACQNALKLVEVLDERIAIRDAVIGPEDIAGDYAVECSFHDKDPVMRAQERTLGLPEVQAGGKSWRRYWEDVGEENAAERVEEAAVERMLSSEQIEGSIIALAAQEFPRRLAAKRGNQLVGPNGQPYLGGVEQPPTGGLSPAVGAMQQQGPLPQGVEQLPVNGVVPGVTNESGVGV